ncbi:MAG: hypothetical protein CM1200mP18_02320 [Gammaproteobacteria bacterium]|nr:MAG: hypothetical protein CM1200mP18_02320 [Gammaproteobacteria bacterium]
MEAADRPGGQINLAARVLRRKEILGITDWLFDQVERLGVKIRLGCYAEARTVEAERPDIVLSRRVGFPTLRFSVKTKHWQLPVGTFLRVRTA